MNWFDFSPPDFLFAFLSIVLEGIPFLLLGTLVSGVLDAFLPARVMARLLPKNPVGAIGVSVFLGILFPMCECGIVPVIRRLMRKGLPLGCGVAYMLAAPILNPVVALSTFAAFKGQSPMEMTVLRLSLGAVIAFGVGCVAYMMGADRVLNRRTRELIASKKSPARKVGLTIASDPESGAAPAGFLTKMAVALRVAASDFLDVAIYLVLGAAITAVFNTGVRQEIISPLASHALLAPFAMMVLAGILSLCSTSDAFIAATFNLFHFGAKLAFLVFGPMMDLKLVFLYSAVFQKRFVISLAVGLFVVIGLICSRITFLGL